MVFKAECKPKFQSPCPFLSHQALQICFPWRQEAAHKRAMWGEILYNTVYVYFFLYLFSGQKMVESTVWDVEWNLSPATQSRASSRNETSERNSVLTLMGSILTSTVSFQTCDGSLSTVEVSVSGGSAHGWQAGVVSRHKSHTALYFSSLVLMKDRCKLFCRVVGSTAYYQLRDRVIDGTPCGQDTSDICVQGLCRVSPRWCFHHAVVLLSCHGFLGWGTAANISREVVLRVGSPEQRQHHLILMHAKGCEPLLWVFLYILSLSVGLHKTSPWKCNNFHTHSFTVTSVLRVKPKYSLIATSRSNSSAPERCHREELASLRSILLILSRIASTGDIPVIYFERGNQSGWR